MTLFPALVTPFPKILFNNKGAANNKRNPPPVSVIPFPKDTFYQWRRVRLSQWRTISAISEAGKSRKQEELHESRKSCTFFSYFVFYCFSSTIINRSVFSRYSTILIILSFPALRAPRPLIFLSNLSITGKGTTKWFFA